MLAVPVPPMLAGPPPEAALENAPLAPLPPAPPSGIVVTRKLLPGGVEPSSSGSS